MAASKDRLRFKIADDLVLLQQVLALNPFADISKWEEVTQHVARFSGKPFSLRTVREHLSLLLQLFQKNDRANLRKSGTEKQYDEKEQLLQQVKELREEFIKTNTPSRNTKKARDAGVAICQGAVDKMDLLAFQGDEACTALEFLDVPVEITYEQSPEGSQSPTEEGCAGSFNTCLNVVNRTRPLSYLDEQNADLESSINKYGNHEHRRFATNTLMQKAGLQLLEKRADRDHNMRERELLLEERKIRLSEDQLAFEKEKFHLEKYEREQRLQMDIEEHRARMKRESDQMNLLIRLKGDLTN